MSIEEASRAGVTRQIDKKMLSVRKAICLAYLFCPYKTLGGLYGGSQCHPEAHAGGPFKLWLNFLRRYPDRWTWLVYFFVLGH